MKYMILHGCLIKNMLFKHVCLPYGRKDGIRTHDLLVPNQAHYQAVLLPEVLEDKIQC